MQIIKKLECLLYKYESVKRIFASSPMVSYRSARKLISYLVRPKLHYLKMKPFKKEKELL